MLQWLALASLLTAAAGPATCLLQRDLNFRALGLIQLAGYAVGYLGVGVPMALAGQGADALAAACVVQAAVTLVASYAVKPHPVRPLFSHAGGGAALTTGRTVFLTNVVNWLLSNLDRVVLGRALNTHAVGLYSVAYNLAQIPNVLLVGSLQPTFLAAGAKMQDDRQRLSQGWLLGLACVLVLLTPASVVFALLSEDLVRLVVRPRLDGLGLGPGPAVPVPAGMGLLGLHDAGAVEHRPQAPGVPVATADARPRGAGVVVVAPHGIRWAAIGFGGRDPRAGRCHHHRRALKALDLRWSAVCPVCRPRPVPFGPVRGRPCVAGQHAVATLTFPGASLFAGRRMRCRRHAAGDADAAAGAGPGGAGSAARQASRRSVCAGPCRRYRPMPTDRHDDGPTTGFLHWVLPAMLGVVALAVLLSGRDLSLAFIALQYRRGHHQPHHHVGPTRRLAAGAGGLGRTGLQPRVAAPAHAFAAAHRGVRGRLDRHRGGAGTPRRESRSMIARVSSIR